MKQDESKNASMPKMTVVQIMEKYDKSSVYVKRAFQKGWLVGHKEPMQGTHVDQWVGYTADVEAWRKSAEMHKSSKTSFNGSSKSKRDLQEYLKSAKAEDVVSMKAYLKSIIGE